MADAPLTIAVLGTRAVALLALAWWAKFKDDEATIKSRPCRYLLTLKETLWDQRIESVTVSFGSVFLQAAAAPLNDLLFWGLFAHPICDTIFDNFV